MEDFPTQIADLLENVATKVRSMTVDRVANWMKWVAMAPILLMLGFVAFVFLLIGLFRILAEITESTIIAYAILAGLFLIIAVFLWVKRNSGLEPPESSGSTEEAAE